MRVNAVANTEIVYSVKKSSGENVDPLNWTFNWSIIQTAAQELGEITSSSTTSEQCSVKWHEPTDLFPATTVRELRCEVSVKGADGVLICVQIVLIEVLVSSSVVVTTFELTGEFGYTAPPGITCPTGPCSLETIPNIIGPIRLIDQCHKVGTDLTFKVTGSTGVEYFWWDLDNTKGGYVIDGVYTPVSGNILKTVPDGAGGSSVTVRYTNDVPNADGLYYISVFTTDVTGLASPLTVLRFKLMPLIPLITMDLPIEHPLDEVKIIDTVQRPRIVKWDLSDVQRYPEWLTVDYKLEVGELIMDCATGPVGPCSGELDSHFTGANWLNSGGTMIDLLDDNIYDIYNSLTGTNIYEFGSTVTLPLESSWAYGDSELYRIKLHTEFVDTETCNVTRNLEKQDWQIAFCPNAVVGPSGLVFETDACPSVVPDSRIPITFVPDTPPVIPPVSTAVPTSVATGPSCVGGYTASTEGYTMVCSPGPTCSVWFVPSGYNSYICVNESIVNHDGALIDLKNENTFLDITDSVVTSFDHIYFDIHTDSFFTQSSTGVPEAVATDLPEITKVDASTLVYALTGTFADGEWDIVEDNPTLVTNTIDTYLNS